MLTRLIGFVPLRRWLPGPVKRGDNNQKITRITWFGSVLQVDIIVPFAICIGIFIIILDGPPPRRNLFQLPLPTPFESRLEVAKQCVIS